MITYWLVVSITIAGGDWQVMENTKMPSRDACLAAVADRLEKAETSTVMDAHAQLVGEEREVAVTCSIHWPEEKRL